MRANNMKSSEKDKPTLDDQDDFDETADPEAIPADTDIQEGDEEKEDEPDLPLAMPPGA
jgi:hypothetical protein